MRIPGVSLLGKIEHSNMNQYQQGGLYAVTPVALVQSDPHANGEALATVLGFRNAWVH